MKRQLAYTKNVSRRLIELDINPEYGIGADRARYPVAAVSQTKIGPCSLEIGKDKLGRVAVPLDDINDVRRQRQEAGDCGPQQHMP